MTQATRQTAKTDRSGISVLAGIPAFNEARYVGSIVLRARQYADEVIVVDDGSTDDTSTVAGLAGATVVRHDGNEGKGAAIRSILAEAKKRRPDVLVLLDADSQHNPDEIPSLIDPISQGFDLVIGSREAEKEKTPTYRRIGQRVLRRSIRVISDSDISDSESGFRALSPRAIDALELTESGFAVESEMIARATEKSLRITEVPVSNIYTADGSTLNPVRHGVGVLNRIIVMISQRRPLFFFGTLGSALLAVGLVLGIWVVEVYRVTRQVAMGNAMLVILLGIIGILAIFTGIILNALNRRN